MSVRRLTFAALAAALIGAALPAPALADIEPRTFTLRVVAGTGVAGAVVPGPARQSPLDRPRGVAVAPDGTVYVTGADCRVDKITAAGVISVVAGTTCGAGLPAPGPAASAVLGDLSGVAWSGGNLYVADHQNAAIYRIDAAGQLTVLAGTGVGGLMTNGPAAASKLASPRQLTVANGTLYVGDEGNHQVGAIDLGTGQLTIVAGTGNYGDTVAGQNPLTTPIRRPTGVAVDAAGTVYFSDVEKGSIFRIVGGLTQLVKSSVSAEAIAFDTDGSLYTANGYGSVQWVGVTPASLGQAPVVAGDYVSGPVTEGPALSSHTPGAVALAFGPGRTLHVVVSGTNQIVALGTQSAPGEPAPPTATAGVGKATITWSAPGDGGSPITSYTVQAYAGNVAVPGATCSGTALTCEIAGLTPGTAYTFRVSATNAIGTGNQSDPSAPVTPSAPVVYTPPGAPAAPTATAGTSSINVSWPAASGNVAGYTAYATPGGNSCSTSALTCVIGAVAGTRYTVTVVARGPGGSSAPSPASNAVTPVAPVAPPAVPADVPATLTTDKGPVALTAPEQTITVIGTGFAPHSTARVTIYSDPIVLGTVTTDAQGAFALPVTVPATLDAGAHTFLALGVDPQGTTRRMALPVTVAPTTTGSSGSGETSQQATVPVPAGGAVTLLDASGSPVSTVTVAQGTYALDATTGTITFVPRAGFTGRATAVTYRLTDAVGSVVTGRYTAVVTAAGNEPEGPQPSTGSARVIVGQRVVTNGRPSRATMTATATFSSAVRGRNTVLLWSTVSGRRLTLGRGAVVTTTASRRVVVPVTLNAAGRALAARPGGYPVAVAITTVPSSGRTLRASSRTHLVLSSFTLPRAVSFASGSTAIGTAQARYLAGVRRQLAGVRTVTCTGYTDDRGSRAAGLVLGRKRARAVCSSVSAGLGVRTVVVSKGQANPAASNKTAAGMARNRRADITLTY
ncbi:fibronectin type III domain-containing protein [Symbioplanes lichenis]|uniref:fibronectin type III domain-containing protein n=1 Tax=Symbioplanes lichenis TaxID=1629072 RepID=UPI0027383CA8|nr:fibronectin type III domain-containing protein [Actinoplanes lichenis]